MVNSRHPEAWGKCDRCGSVYLLRDLSDQREWAGTTLVNKRLKVCDRCLDVPAEQLRTVRLGPDPVAVRDPRPLNNAAVMGGYAYISYAASLQGRADFSPEFNAGDFATVPTADFSTEFDEGFSHFDPEAIVALELTLQVVPPGIDAVKGYPGSPFSTEEAELTNIPLSIDPPE